MIGLLVGAMSAHAQAYCPSREELLGDHAGPNDEYRDNPCMDSAGVIYDGKAPRKFASIHADPCLTERVGATVLIVRPETARKSTSTSTVLNLGSGASRLDSFRGLVAPDKGTGALCPGDSMMRAYASDPVLPSSCTGFLWNSEVVVTAGHCTDREGQRLLVVPDYYKGVVQERYEADGYDVKVGPAIGATVIDRVVCGGEPSQECLDVAILRLDSELAGRRGLGPTHSTEWPDGEPAGYVVGHPLGMVLSVSRAGAVTYNSEPLHARISAFQANSGSPVFDCRDHELQGMLVDGRDDFERRASGCLQVVNFTGAGLGEVILPTAWLRARVEAELAKP